MSLNVNSLSNIAFRANSTADKKAKNPTERSVVSQSVTNRKNEY